MVTDKDFSIFNFNGKVIKTVIFNNESCFILKDVMKLLNIKTEKTALKYLTEDMIYTINYENKALNIINEIGFYSLIINNSEIFKNWIVYNLLPETRQDGIISYDELFDIVEHQIKSSKIKKIYFIGDGSGFVKVGISNNPNKRLKQLQCGNVNELKIIFELENKEFKHEAELHQKYAKYRIRGEWFKDEILNEFKNSQTDQNKQVL